MSIIDNNLQLSGSWVGGVWTPQTVTGTDTSVLSTNNIDTTAGLGAAQPVDFGAGEPMQLLVNITTAFAGLTSLEIQYIQADDSAMSTNVNVLASTGAIPLASLTLGRQIDVNINRASLQPYPTRRYVGARYVIVGAGTAGALLATLVRNIGDVPQPAYKSGYAVL